MKKPSSIFLKFLIIFTAALCVLSYLRGFSFAQKIDGYLQDLRYGVPEVRAEAVRKIADTRNSKYIPVVIDTLKDSDSRVRANAVDVLRFLDSPETYEHVAALLEDRNSRVRANAARFYEQADLERNLDILEQMLDSNDPAQIRSARFSLFWIRDERARALLEKANKLLGEN